MKKLQTMYIDNQKMACFVLGLLKSTMSVAESNEQLLGKLSDIVNNIHTNNGDLKEQVGQLKMDLKVSEQVSAGFFRDNLNMTQTIGLLEKQIEELTMETDDYFN